MFGASSVDKLELLIDPLQNAVRRENVRRRFLNMSPGKLLDLSSGERLVMEGITTHMKVYTRSFNIRIEINPYHPYSCCSGDDHRDLGCSGDCKAYLGSCQSFHDRRARLHTACARTL